MTKAELRSQALRLPVDERVELANALGETLDDESAQPALPEWQRQILDERIAADDAAPDAGSPWQEVKRRILASLRSNGCETAGSTWKRRALPRRA
jgi:putative addiction module component (TIGR02574 family)